MIELAGRRVHLLGIGGAGLSALAEVLLGRGARVSGCDVARSVVTDRLVALGAEVSLEGQSPAHVAGQDLLCHTTRLHGAAREEVAAGHKAGIEVLDRPQLLARLIAAADAIGVAGTHGKTTTTALVAHLLEGCGELPTALIGDGASSRARDPELLVAELDESDRTLPLHHPGAAIVTGVEFDHGDFFADLADVRAMFGAFLAGLPASGVAVLCSDDGWLREQSVPGRRVTYGIGDEADYRLLPDGAILWHGKELTRLRLRVPGPMTRLDATAAVAVAVERGIEPERAARSLDSFAGARRRLERLGFWRGAVLYDDYGHLPAQVGPTVEALRELAPERVLLVYQPHRFSRFPETADALVPALRTADRTLLAEIYGAGEANPAGLSARPLAARAEVDFAADLPAVRRWLEAQVQGGDLVLLMGAGDVGRVGRGLARES